MAVSSSNTVPSRKTFHNIKLIYESVDGVEHLRADADSWDIREGDELHFESAAGDVHVLMIPGDQFSAEEFRTGDKPVVVYTSTSFNFCCGVKSGSTVIGYPEHQRFGTHVEQPSPDRGTTP
jgi:hypothetical protein